MENWILWKWGREKKGNLKWGELEKNYNWTVI